MMKVAFTFCLLFLSTKASVISKSSKEECVIENDVKNEDKKTCSTKLVVSLTINANEGKSQLIQANVSRIFDTTRKKLKSLELKSPLRIKVIKSPVVINFKLYQVGYVSNWPREEIKNERRGKRFECHEAWYSKDDEVNCGFAKNQEGEKIFDSQGFCCECRLGLRGGTELCSGFDQKMDIKELKDLYNEKTLEVGHCMVYDGLKYYVMGLQPPALHFTITVVIERRDHLTTNGSGAWTTISELEIGPQKRIALSDTHHVKVEYVADFHPSTFISTDKLVHRYLLIPNVETLSPDPPFPDVPPQEWKHFMKSVQNMSEWMAIDKTFFDMSGFSCNKIGVSYSAFRRQPHACARKYGNCLFDQPYLLWKDEKLRQKERRSVRFMLYSFGKVHSMPHTSGRTDFQVNFIADRPTTSLVVITMAADDLKTINKVAPGRIVSAYIDAFEALSSTGTLLTIIQNTGVYTATYNVFVQHCSAGIDLVPSKLITLNPSESKNITFIIHSFHSVGKINKCELGLFDINSKMLDSLEVTIETLDTCFCYGFCGCACGNNKTVCPDAPNRPDSELEVYTRKWYERLGDFLKKVGKFFRQHGGKFLIIFWVVFLLILLGICKVAHILITQEVKMGAVTEPIMIIMKKLKEVADYIIKEWCPAFCDNFWTSCCNCSRFCCRHCCWIMTLGKVSRRENMLYKKRIERGWRAPPYCNGMCEGAKFRRRLHRKLMRVMKRTGQRKEAPWYGKPYNCSCKVKDQMPCVTICKGLFFFFYCPLLPVFWMLEFTCTYVRRRFRRWKRIQDYREEKAEKEAAKQRQYTYIDKYSRGLVENEIVSLDKQLREIRRLEKEYEEGLGLDPELAEEELQMEIASDREDRNMSSEASLSDTSDPDQANDVEELLDPGYPVYFNCGIPKPSHPLNNPGNSYSIKGRLTKKEKKKGTRYHFDLDKDTQQVAHRVKGTMQELVPPLILQPEDFAHTFKDPKRVLKLVTLVALFPCPNEHPKRQKIAKTKRGKSKKEKKD